jgi:hypothetical protein
VDITTLPAPQLSTLQARLSQELEHLTTSHTRLKSAQQRFRECIKSIEGGVKGQRDGKKTTLILLLTHAEEWSVEKLEYGQSHLFRKMSRTKLGKRKKN